MRNFFKFINRKKVRFNEKKNEIHVIDYNYDRSREKMSARPRSLYIKAFIEVNQFKETTEYHPESVNNTTFREISFDKFNKYYDDINDEFKFIVPCTRVS